MGHYSRVKFREPRSCFGSEEALVAGCSVERVARHILVQNYVSTSATKVAVDSACKSEKGRACLKPYFQVGEDVQGTY